MAQISKTLAGMMFGGTAPVVLAAAPWKDNLRTLYGINAAGDGYVVFKPENRFNSLSQLVRDGVYIIEAARPFDLPDALLGVPAAGGGLPTAPPPAGSGPLALVAPDIFYNTDPAVPFMVNFSLKNAGNVGLGEPGILSINTTPRPLLAVAVGTNRYQANDRLFSSYGSGAQLERGKAYELTIMALSGNRLVVPFTIPQLP